MEKIPLKLLGMINSQSQTGAYTLILAESDGKKRLPILINGFEAQAILFHIEKVEIPRPLTHDLFKNFSDTFGIAFREVIITKFHQGIFYANLICSDGIITHEIDSRTSDAIALAVRFNCPIYTYRKVMDEAGVSLEEEQMTDADEDTEDEFLTEDVERLVPPPASNLEKFTIEELEEMLREAVEHEEYERASAIRDAIQRIKGK